MAVNSKSCAIRRGVVMRIDKGRMVVGVERGEACGACAARGICGAPGGALHEVEVALPKQAVRVGDRVELSVSDRESFKALLIAYGVPFLIVLVALIGFISAGMREGVAGLLSIALVVPYYVFLYIFRKRLTAKVSITSEQKEN